MDALIVAAAEHLAAEVLQRHPALPIARDDGRMLRAELQFHLQALSAALTLSRPECFCDHLRWIASVLAARNVPAAVLDDALSALAGYCRAHLPPGIRDAAQQALDLGMVALSGGSADSSALVRVPAAFAGVDEFAESLLAGDAEAARAALYTAAGTSTEGYVAAAAHLLQPALYKIGYWWERNVISVGQEHLASGIAATLLSELPLAVPAAPPRGRKALFAGLAGNTHVLGLRTISDMFRLSGWSVQFLGPDTPTASIVRQVELWQPEVVGLSAALVQQLPELRRTIDIVRTTFGTSRPMLMIGGLATNQHADIWRSIGADLWFPDVETAAAYAGGG